jgi:hypothetical protein
VGWIGGRRDTRPCVSYHPTSNIIIRLNEIKYDCRCFKWNKLEKNGWLDGKDTRPCVFMRTNELNGIGEIGE